MHKILFYLEKKLGAAFLRLYRKTLRFKVINQASSDHIRCIYMTWHRNLLILTLQRIDHGAAVLVSSSKDGELIAGPLSELGYTTVRGSTTRQGSRAMLEMIKAGKTGSLAITPDGPKGPVHTIQPGVFQIALLSKIPIVPIAVHADREWLFNSWDKFRFPKPLARLDIIYSDPIPVNSKDDFKSAEKQIRAFMREHERKLTGD